MRNGRKELTKRKPSHLEFVSDDVQFQLGVTSTETTMKWIVLAFTVSLFAVGPAIAQEAACATKAVGKDGKPLAGGTMLADPSSEQGRQATGWGGEKPAL